MSCPGDYVSAEKHPIASLMALIALDNRQYSDQNSLLVPAGFRWEDQCV